MSVIQFANIGILANTSAYLDSRILIPPSVTVSTSRLTGPGGEPKTGVAGLIFNDNGSLEEYITPPTSDIPGAPSDYGGGAWYLDQDFAGIGAQYEIFVNTPTLTGGTAGTVTQPTLNTWIDLSDVTFEASDVGDNTTSTYNAEWVYSIRNKATQAAVVTDYDIALTVDLVGF